MQFDKVQGYMEKDEVVLLRQGMPPTLFRYRDHCLVKVDETQDPQLVDKALAYSLFAQSAYAKRLYH